MENTAKLSECRKYRFALWRTRDDSKPYVMFIGQKIHSTIADFKSIVEFEYKSLKHNVLIPKIP